MGDLVPLRLHGLTPKPGFDWSRVKWTARTSETCSYCGRLIGDEELPLMLFHPKGAGAQFCEGCQLDWWELEGPEDDDAR